MSPSRTRHKAGGAALCLPGAAPWPPPCSCDRSQRETRHPPAHPPRRRDILDISSPLNDAAAAIVDDSFLRCFKSLLDDPWNWCGVLLVPLSVAAFFLVGRLLHALL